MALVRTVILPLKDVLWVEILIAIRLDHKIISDLRSHAREHALVHTMALLVFYFHYDVIPSHRRMTVLSPIFGTMYFDDTKRFHLDRIRNVFHQSSPKASLSAALRRRRNSSGDASIVSFMSGSGSPRVWSMAGIEPTTGSTVSVSAGSTGDSSCSAV